MHDVHVKQQILKSIRYRPIYVRYVTGNQLTMHAVQRFEIRRNVREARSVCGPIAVNKTAYKYIT